MVRIRLKWPLSVLAWWCSSVVLCHAGVNAWSSKDGVSHHDRDRPGTGQLPESQSHGKLQNFILR